MRLALVAAVVALAATGCSDEADPAETPTKVVLGLGPDIETFDRCPPVTVRRLARQDVAFSGTLDIQRPDGEDWVFTVDRWYAGGDADLAVVRGNAVSISYFADTSHPGQTAPQEGGRYLVAGRRGDALACLTRPWSAALAGRFERAYR